MAFIWCATPMCNRSVDKPKKRCESCDYAYKLGVKAGKRPAVKHTLLLDKYVGRSK